LARELGALLELPLLRLPPSRLFRRLLYAMFHLDPPAWLRLSPESHRVTAERHPRPAFSITCEDYLGYRVRHDKARPDFSSTSRSSFSLSSLLHGDFFIYQRNEIHAAVQQTENGTLAAVQQKPATVGRATTAIPTFHSM
jgi:hypothetical protein